MCLLLALVLIDFFYFIFAVAVNSTHEANKAGGVRAIKQSILLDVYGLDWEKLVFLKNVAINST